MAQPPVTLRSVKGAPLTWQEGDENFSNLSAAALPTGGVTGQILAKSGSSDYAVSFVDASTLQGVTGSVGPIAGTDGQLIYNNGGISGGANTWFDDTNQRLGIRTSTPSATLDVVGDIEVNSNVNLNSEATTLATTTKTQVASFTASSFRSGKLIVQAYDTFTNEVQVSELLVAHNGTTASATEYGVVFTGANPLVVYDVDISSGNVRLLAQRTTPNPTQYTVSETLLSAFDPAFDPAFGAFSWDSNTASPGPA